MHHQSLSHSIDRWVVLLGFFLGPSPVGQSLHTGKGDTVTATTDMRGELESHEYKPSPSPARNTQPADVKTYGTEDCEVRMLPA